MVIYLDNHASTPVDPRVLEAMLPFLAEKFGNASSRTHPLGREADEAVERARGQVARLLGADPSEIVFTSGATEANNLALRGVAEAAGGGHLVASPIEHPSVLDTLDDLASRGFEVTYLPVDAQGRIRPEDVAAAITERTRLVTVMTANNEIGTLQPIREIARLAAERGVCFHTDATQGVGRIPFDVRADHVHLASLTAHKIYGPKGCGALYVRRRGPEVRLVRQIHGGSHERGRRAGTLNVPGIVGLGMACELCRVEREEESRRTAALRDRLQERLFAGLADLEVNGAPDQRLPNNLHLSFAGVDSQSLMRAVPEVAVSSGAACASGSVESSPVLQAIGLAPARAASSIRFGLGRFNTAAEIDEAAHLFLTATRRLRAARS
ncbi:MAG: cysteine desulfurase family protein [Planctomycetota bacterium]